MIDKALEYNVKESDMALLDDIVNSWDLLVTTTRYPRNKETQEAISRIRNLIHLLRVDMYESYDDQGHIQIIYPLDKILIHKVQE